MSPGIGVGVGLPFVHLQRRSSSILDQLFGGGQGMYAVAGLREGSGAWTDQTGGGRHVTLPGGSADPIQLDHDGTDYFYLPGTGGNTLTVPGLSVSTAYDYKVFYEDATTATGEETTDGSGVLTLGGTQTNFDAKSVTRIRVVADGADVDAATAVADILASDADEDSSTFTEASSNAATVTINRGSSGYPLMVVQRPWSLAATDDYMTILDPTDFFDVDEGEVLNVVAVIWNAGTEGIASIVSKRAGVNDTGWELRTEVLGAVRVEVDDGTSEVFQPTPGTPRATVTVGGIVNKSDDLVNSYTPTSGLSVGGDISSLGDLMSPSSAVEMFRESTFYFAGGCCAVAIQKAATPFTAEQFAEVGAALLALNSGG